MRQHSSHFGLQPGLPYSCPIESLRSTASSSAAMPGDAETSADFIRSVSSRSSVFSSNWSSWCLAWLKIIQLCPATSRVRSCLQQQLLAFSTSWWQCWEPDLSKHRFDHLRWYLLESQIIPCAGPAYLHSSLYCQLPNVIWMSTYYFGSSRHYFEAAEPTLKRSGQNSAKLNSRAAIGPSS